MKLAWAAMAVATVLAIAALLWDLFGRPAAPFLAANGPWPRSLCDHPPTGARGTARPLPGYRLYFEGMSRLAGGCHPLDAETGIAAVERAFAQGLPGAFAISFANALAARGRQDELQRWLGIAAIVAIDWRFLGFETFGVPLPVSSELHAEIARLRELFGRAEPASLAAEFEAALSRGGDRHLRKTVVDAALVGRLFQVDPAAANYWRYRADRVDGEPAFLFGVLHPNLAFAQECGSLPALEEAARIYIESEKDPGGAYMVIDSLILARDNGADVGKVLDIMAERYSSEFELSDSPEWRARHAQSVEKTCPETFATQRRYFEARPR